MTEAYLELELSIKNNLTDNDLVNIDDENSLKLNIPLLENITSITKEGEFNTKDTLYNITKGNMNYATLTAGLCLIAVSICFTITSLKMFVELNNITIYTMEQNKILKRYGDVIAETKAKPDLKDLEVIDITNFIDLINIEDELRIPILFFETHKGKESWFIIIHNDKAYRYTLQLETNKK